MMKSMFGIKSCALSDIGICTALKGRNTSTMGLAHVSASNLKRMLNPLKSNYLTQRGKDRMQFLF